MAATLYRKVFDLHTVRRLPTGQTQLFIGLHLVHEVTSPQAFDMIRARGGRVPFPGRTVATVDHIVPTDGSPRPFADSMAEEMLRALERNCRDFGIRFFELGSDGQGIVHVIGPELGLTQPGMTIACGDSHTSTHGAFGALAFGIGTSQVRDVLASQTLAVEPLKVRRIEVDGALGRGVSAKDAVLAILGRLGVKAGAGFAYEYGGAAVEAMSMDERMTLCNMSIEGGARAGYVNPDATTFADLKGRPFAPQGEAWDRAVRWWSSLASDPGAAYDDTFRMDGSALEPMVTWGINPGQVAPVTGRVPRPEELSADARAPLAEALEYMGLEAGRPVAGIPVNVAFIGSCTNGRLSDLREAARVATGRRVARGVRALVVPGSNAVRKAAEAEGLHEIFREAGFEWRDAGCSMCLAMNPDRLVGRETCASSSNRNFKGRQGSPTGRTLLMSPAMVAAAAIAGEVADVRTMLR
ncbi:MAG TPA: 3-isopropylmalate dehydratase large subunit [Thermoanaerobaculia bacterium]|nr:3-isopropylmalate dehydratase large subunit [Thermoanaerobaculia bacterium]